MWDRQIVQLLTAGICRISIDRAYSNAQAAIARDECLIESFIMLLVYWFNILIPYQKTKVIGILQRKAGALGNGVEWVVRDMKLNLELVRQAFG